MNFHDLSTQKILFFFNSLLLKCHILSGLGDLGDLSESCVSEHSLRAAL